MYALIFGIIIQGIALATGIVIVHDVKSGNTFKTLLAQRHAGAETHTKPLSKTIILDAPEGWDHACFQTEVTEKRWGNELGYSWLIALREQPFQMYPDQTLSAWRPHVILMVDDSRGMLNASGYSYDDSRVYLKRPGGEIVSEKDRDDLTSDLSTAGGTLFRGLYGNTAYPAQDAYHFGGVMQCWTLANSYLSDLVDDLDMCPMAVATVSKGMIQPFTTDRKTLMSVLKGIQPQGSEARLSESLLSLMDAFPSDCITSRHIIIATSGIAVHDGNISSIIRDFDHDGNLNDRFMDDTGSHCLDDVAAYAFSRAIRVHVVGPRTDFLRNTAMKGGGAFMPTRQSFNLPGGFLSQAPCLSGQSRLFLTNVDLACGPPWLGISGTEYERLMANGSPHLNKVSPFIIKGTVLSLFHENSLLLCTTSRDNLLLVDLPSGACRWIAQGPGGKVTKKDSVIIAGPNMDGDIIAMSCNPGIIWSDRGHLFAAGRGSVYVADGSTITSHSLSGGMYQGRINLDSRVCVLEYDPCTGNVLAGTQSGNISVMDQDLNLQSLSTPGLQGTLTILRSFRMRKDLRIIAATRTNVACITTGGTVWKAVMADGICTGALVMDSKVYITAWEPGACEGIDSGKSAVIVLDATDGRRISGRSLFGTKAYGPVVGLESKALVYAGSGMEVSQVDIKDLTGMKPESLGSRAASD